MHRSAGAEAGDISLESAACGFVIRACTRRDTAARWEGVRFERTASAEAPLTAFSFNATNVLYIIFISNNGSIGMCRMLMRCMQKL